MPDLTHVPSLNAHLGSPRPHGSPRPISPGDSLFLHYSGHGSRVPDASGDETSGYDSTMCPVDYDINGQILDDDIFAIVAAKVPHGCELFALMDCCHSGTILDLPYNVKCDGSMANAMAMGQSVVLQANPKFFKKTRLLALAAVRPLPPLAPNTHSAACTCSCTDGARPVKGFDIFGLSVLQAGGAGMLVGGPCGCLAAMCCAAGAMAAHDHVNRK